MHCICYVSHKRIVSPYFHHGASFCQILDDQIQAKPYFKLYLVIEPKKKKICMCANYCKQVVYIFACIENILCNYVSFLNTIGIYAILHIVVINTQFHTHHMWGWQSEFFFSHSLPIDTKSIGFLMHKIPNTFFIQHFRMLK